MKQESTRERIVTEALRLFARRGFRGTTVGEIEQAAGLAPRAGGLYKHFRSKEEVLEAGIERHVSEFESMRSALEMLPLGDLRSELTLIARWGLAELREEQQLMKIVQKDGDQFPKLAAEVHERIIAPGHREATRVFERLFGDRPIANLEALAAVALGSLVDYRIEESMFGSPPGGVAEDDFIEAWVQVWLTFADATLPQETTVEEGVAHGTR
jgi:AcrR family transcriptional regulator